MSQTSSQPQAPRGFKRKRTAHACEECRSRKSRCDGGRPVCDKCNEMGFLCHYNPPKKSSESSESIKKTPDSTTASFEARLDRMQQLLETLISKADAGGSPCFSKSPPETHSMHLTSSTDPVDGMACMTFKDETDAGHFGPTSNSAFLEHIVNAVNGLPRAHTLRLSQKRRLPISLSDWSSPGSAAQEPAVPSTAPFSTSRSPEPLSYEATMGLLQRYFLNTGDMFPYLSKASLLAYLGHSGQVNLEKLRPAPRCLVYTCLAFARIHGGSENNQADAMQDAQRNFEAARATLPDLMSQTPDMETVQALILFLQYSQGTQSSSETWGLMAAIVQRAFQIGLYRSNTTTGMTFLEVKTRTKTWHMVYMMDKMCSMTFGRPPLVPNNYMDTSLPLTGSINLENNTSYQSRDTSIELASPDLFLQTCKLNLILGEIIETVYGSNIEGLLPSSLLDLQQHILRIEGRLSEWKNQLPRLCQFLNSSDMDSVQLLECGVRDRRTLVILSLRYLNIRSLLHRATLFQFLNSKSLHHDPRESLKSHSSVNTCIEDAVLSIKIISQSVQRRDILPIWWFSAYYTLTASLTIFAAICLLLKEPNHLQRYTVHELLSMLQVALISLDNLQQDSLVVDRCQQALHLVVHMCWAVIGQPLRSESLTTDLKQEMPPAREHDGRNLDFTDSLFDHNSGTCATLTSSDLWLPEQIDFDGICLHDLVGNLQAFIGHL